MLRCGDPRGYARTLLALTEQCLPLGAVRPGLGLLGARWTLADRVAGLLDTRRIPMTRTTFRMKIAVWVLLTDHGISRRERPARPFGAGRRAPGQANRAAGRGRSRSLERRRNGGR